MVNVSNFGGGAGGGAGVEGDAAQYAGGCEGAVEGGDSG